ncbi:MAG: hypothetical protein EU981_02375 [Candidatus Liberibacter ctenarytainae]|uniref:Peptidase S24/S26A/S26B/S26C domain-containing protein n=1 Tax=Candidatus Liberibacter ctenarytainae TaxID=2020335 RepID=A0A937AQ75_9HYPH|nr:hypothetical protein [Candidatus Liberibacter ctenarytainae]
MDHPHAVDQQKYGDSMVNAGIFDMVDNQVTVKRFKRDESGVYLMPENEKYKPIRIQNHESLEMSGVVSGVVRDVVA